MKMTEEELLATDKWKKDTLMLHIAELDSNAPSGVRRLSYDVGDTFSLENIVQIEAFIREVNIRFPNIKMFATGTGFVPIEDENEQSV